MKSILVTLVCIVCLTLSAVALPDRGGWYRCALTNNGQEIQTVSCYFYSNSIIIKFESGAQITIWDPDVDWDQQLRRNIYSWWASGDNLVILMRY